MRRHYMQIYRHTLSVTDKDNIWIDINTLEVHPDVTEQLADLGIVEIHSGHVKARQVSRIQKLMRLRRDLGVNLPGAAIILDLLERMEEMQEEIEKLKRR